MAISGSAVYEVRSTAAAGNVNGGLFVNGTGRIDFSMQDLSQYTFTDLVSAGADAIVLSASSAVDMLGNGCMISGGTNVNTGRYEVISVVPGVSFTLDRAWATGVAVGGTMKIGGALSLGSNDDYVLDTMVTSGNKFYIKGGSSIAFTLGGTVNIGFTAGTQTPVEMEGYDVVRGDKPQGPRRPTINPAATILTSGGNYNWTSLQFTGTATSVFSTGANNAIKYCKFTNTSGTAGRNALNIAALDPFLLGVEAISYKGNAFNVAAGQVLTAKGCYAHDSNQGFMVSNNAGAVNIHDTIIAGCVGSAVNITVSTVQNLISNCTLHSINATGTGVFIGSGVTDVRLINNTITGFNVGVFHGDSQSVGQDEYNNYFNNATDVTRWQKGTTSLAFNPDFALVGSVVITAATTTSAPNQLTKAGETFITKGVVAGRDFVNITSSSLGIFGIVSVDSETQLTLDLAPGNNTANVNAQIITGRNFSPGTNLKAMAYPMTFPGSSTVSYLDIGAAQRQEVTTVVGGGSGIRRTPTGRI